MGVYKAAVVTENGQHLIAQAFTSEKKLIFTSAKTSSYSYPAGTNISALTGLQDVVQSVIPSGTKTIGGNVAQVTVRFDNDSIDQAYLIQAIGLYAKIEDGEEILFSVTQATVPDEMPVHSEVSPSAYIYNIQSTVQNASQITITVNPTGAASVQDFLDIQNPTFDDSGTSEEISSFPEFLDTVKSKMNFFQFFRNLKSGLQFVLHVGSIVNNCVTDNPNLPLSAAQGKVLMDYYTKLYSDLNTTLLYRGVITGDLNRGRNFAIAPGIYSIQTVATIANGPSDFSGWGIFVQFPDNLFSQMILNSSSYIKFRKYAGSNPTWTEW